MHYSAQGLSRQPVRATTSRSLNGLRHLLPQCDAGGGLRCLRA